MKLEDRPCLMWSPGTHSTGEAPVTLSSLTCRTQDGSHRRSENEPSVLHALQAPNSGPTTLWIPMLPLKPKRSDRNLSSS